MSPRSAISILLLLLVLVLGAGQSARRGLASTNDMQSTAANHMLLPLVHGPPIFSARPNPLSLNTARDTSRAVSATITTAGGTLNATGADGTRYTLTLPKDALLVDTAITLTPITSVGGLPSSVKFVAGVDVKPDGLRLYQAATLVIQPPAAKTVPVEREVSFASLGNGAQAHLYPLQIRPRVPTFSLFHFSSYYVGDGITIDMNDRMPTLTEAQIQHYMHEVIQAEREAQQRGEEGDPLFEQKLEYLLREYFNVAIAPSLRAIPEDCATAEGIIPRALSWQRQVQLPGMDGSFATEGALVQSGMIKLIERCWNEVTKPCLDKANAAQMARAISIARQAQLMGLEGYDPFAVPGCNCSNVAQVTQGWIATLDFSWSDEVTRSRSGMVERATGHRSANVTARLDQRDGSASWYGYLTGTTRYEDLHHVTYRDGEEVWSRTVGNGPPRAVDRGGADVRVRFSVNAAACTYYLWVPIRIDAQSSHSDGRSNTTDAVVANLHVIQLPVRWTEQTTDFTIRDTQYLRAGEEGPIARLYFPGGVSYPTISLVNGAFADVRVRISITPIAPPSQP